MMPMNPANQKYVDLVKDSNITAEEAIERFDVNIERLINEDVDKEKDEDAVNLLNVLSAWLEEALQKGTDMQTLQPRASKLAKVAFNLGCSEAEVKELLTMRPKSI